MGLIHRRTRARTAALSGNRRSRPATSRPHGVGRPRGSGRIRTGLGVRRVSRGGPGGPRTARDHRGPDSERHSQTTNPSDVRRRSHHVVLPTALQKTPCSNKVR